MNVRKTPRPVVVITGASGLVGTRVANELSEDYDLLALDVQPLPPEFPEAHFIECDLTSDAGTAEAFAKLRVHAGPRLASVVHLAAYYDFSGEPSDLYEKLTVQGTRRLLRGLRADFQVEQFVFASSLLVMKPVDDGGALSEDSPVQAEWDYPQSKLDAEERIRKEHGDIPAVILRMAGAYDEKGHSPPITQQIWRIREKKLESFVFPGDRSHGQSFIHLADVASCFRAVIDHRDTLGAYEVFLIGEPETLSYGELQDRIGELVHGNSWPTLRIPAPVAKAGAWLKDKAPSGSEQFIKPWMVDLADAHYPVDITRTTRRLHWAPRRQLRTTLPRMIEELERDPRGWYEENGLPTDDGPPARSGAGSDAGSGAGTGNG